jgi:hypothetical protein
MYFRIMADPYDLNTEADAASKEGFSCVPGFFAKFLT